MRISVERAVLLILVLATAAAVFIAYGAGHPFRAYLIENADLLYLPTLFTDLLERGGRLNSWYLTPAPYFFPDYPLYLVAHLLGSSSYSRIALFGVAQVLATVAVLWVLARSVSRRHALMMATIIVIALVWLAFNAGEPFVILLASASHYGAFIAAILVAGLWLRYWHSDAANGRALLLAAVCLVAFLSALSDTFFVVQGLAPLFATAVVMEPRDNRPRTRPLLPLVALWAVLGLALPLLVYRLPVSTPAVNVAWAPDVTDGERAQLESRFHLTEGEFRGEQLWTYRITETSRSNVSALVQSPRVRDTHHIDRVAFVVDGATSRGRRAMSVLPMGLAAAAFVVAGVAFLGALWRARHDWSLMARQARALSPIAAGLLGLVAYPLVVAHPTGYSRSVGIEKAYANASDVYTMMSRVLETTPAYAAMLVAYLGVIALVLGSRVTRRERWQPPEALVWIAVFSLWSLCSVLVTATLMTDLPVMPRYLIPAFLWPVVVVALFLGYLLRYRLFIWGTALSTAMVCLLYGDAYPLVRANGWSSRYYPPEIACMDTALEDGSLRHGIAQYWDAKYLQQFSRRDIQLAQYLEDLGEMRWITSARYFRDSYDFAVIDEAAEPAYKISADALARINGEPARVVSCGKKSIYIYGADKLRTSRSSSGG